MHRRFNEPTNPDVLAFHEAFADLVAMFQHFSLPEILKHQVAATRGDLESQNQLGELGTAVRASDGHALGPCERRSPARSTPKPGCGPGQNRILTRSRG